MHLEGEPIVTTLRTVVPAAKPPPLQSLLVVALPPPNGICVQQPVLWNLLVSQDTLKAYKVSNMSMQCHLSDAIPFKEVQIMADSYDTHKLLKVSNMSFH